MAGCSYQVNNNTSAVQSEIPNETEQTNLPIVPPAQPSNPAPNTLQGTVVAPSPQTHEIDITSSGFSESKITINKGDTVLFVNKDSAPHWPASDLHPTHCEYKGCGVFDAKRGLMQSENYSFVFDLVGSWGFHDHLHSSWTGTITVE